MRVTLCSMCLRPKVTDNPCSIPNYEIGSPDVNTPPVHRQDMTRQVGSGFRPLDE